MFRSKSIQIVFFYTIAVLFILLNAYFFVKRDSLILNALPFVLAIVLLAFFSLDRLLLVVLFFTPLSIPLKELMPGLPIDMFLPTEPLLFGILLLLILKVAHEKGLPRSIVLHPVSVVIYFHLGWMLLVSITSTMPLVSLKFWLSRVWFIGCFYFLTILVLRQKQNFEQLAWFYIVPLILVIFYTTYRHLGFGLWDKQAAHYVMSPFFNDHTSYGAVLAMYIPFVIGFSFQKQKSTWIKLGILAALGILFMALVLSYTRAAWMSVVAIGGVWAIIKLRIRFKPLFITGLSALLLLLVFQKQLVMYLERNSEESSANMMEHISSMSNISTDASNLERINRWSCALYMFSDKPIFGYGPGTYMFQYAPYQLSQNRTIISTNSADGGNAHSEYLGPLAEQGVPGLLSILLLIGVVVYTGVHTYSRLTDKRLRTIVLAALLGLITYYIHGIMNNFLDTDKASAPFWGFTAMIVVLDLYSRQQQNNLSD